MKIVGYEKSCETHFYKLVKEQGIVKKVRISKEDYLKKMVKKGGYVSGPPQQPTYNSIIRTILNGIQGNSKWNPNNKNKIVSNGVNGLIKHILKPRHEPIHQVFYSLLKQNYIKGKVLNDDDLVLLIKQLSIQYKANGRNTDGTGIMGITKNDIISYIKSDNSLSTENQKSFFESYIASIYDVINKKN